MRTLPAALAGLTVGCLALTGCSADATSKSEGPQAETLTVIAPGKPSNLNPALDNVSESELWYVSLLYEPLIHLGAGGKLEPALAQSWEYVGEGNKEFRLHLRSDAKFSDGTPVTADAVAKSLNYTRSAKGLVSIYVANVTSVTATDTSTVVIKTSTPNPVLPNILTNALLIGDVINPKALATPDSLSKTPAGAGPYVLDQAQTVTSDHYTFTPNPHYYDKSAIQYKKIVIKVISNPSSALQTLQSGGADLMVGDINTVTGAKTSNVTVSSAPVSAVGIDLLDREGVVVKALGDKRVRQALNHAVDRDTIAKALLKGYGEPAAQVGAPGTPGFLATGDDRYPYDPAKAKQLLADAGYAKGFTMNIEILSNNTIGEVAQAVIPYWEKIGVKVKADNQTDIATWVGNVNSKKFSSFGFGYGFLPFSLYASSWYLPVVNPFNAFGTEDAQLTALVNQGNTASGDAQTRLYEQATERALELAWIVPVARTSVLYYTGSKVGNVKVDGARPFLDLTEVTPAGN
jgi:peptide/nickel transport system substrate-binding protein